MVIISQLSASAVFSAQLMVILAPWHACIRQRECFLGDCPGSPEPHSLFQPRKLVSLMEIVDFKALFHQLGATGGQWVGKRNYDTDMSFIKREGPPVWDSFVNARTRQIRGIQPEQSVCVPLCLVISHTMDSLFTVTVNFAPKSNSHFGLNPIVFINCHGHLE